MKRFTLYLLWMGGFIAFASSLACPKEIRKDPNLVALEAQKKAELEKSLKKMLVREQRMAIHSDSHI